MLDINPLSFISFANIFSQCVVILDFLSPVYGVLYYVFITQLTYPSSCQRAYGRYPAICHLKRYSFSHLWAQLMSTCAYFSKVSLGNLGVEPLVCGPPPRL